ncbi:unnamed protein product [Sphagnum jensenii]|uniref:Ribosomal RNA small subunit methyltransferase NEP1 n=1 Tax=Sphagnum jensenii TaxID=128206 RepID=A0ABP0VJS2_9BRYO
MVGVEDRNEDVAEEAPGPSSVPDAAAPVPAPSAEDGGVIFVLEKASLEAAKVGKNYQLLNCEDHATFLKKHKRDPALYRPDILHQVCLHLEINVQLLQKLSIRASNGPDKLMRIVKQPVTRYLPLGARRMSYSAPKFVQLSDYVAAAGLSSTYIFVVGAMAHGKIDVDYIDDLVAGKGNTPLLVPNENDDPPQCVLKDVIDSSIAWEGRLMRKHA